VRKGGLSLVSNEENKNKKKETSHVMDIVMWSIWLVLMWGFLIALSVIKSPSDSPGVHEIIITGYFLGFPIIFALMYIIYLKRR